MESNNKFQLKIPRKILLISAAVFIVIAAVILFIFSNKKDPEAVPTDASIAETTVITDTKASTATKAVTTTTTATTTKTPETTAAATTENSHQDIRKKEYSQILNNIFINNETPSGNPLFSLAGNKFSICDVDGDGNEELIILCTQTASVGMECIVYDCSESGELVHELKCFPVVTFYDNGIVKVNSARSQSVGGDFWPYSVFKYSEASDTYEILAYVSAWDVKNFPSDFDGNDLSHFDTSGSGYAYSVRKEPTDNIYMDKSDFDSWYDSVFGSAKPIDLQEIEISAENILEKFPELRQ